MKILTLVGKNDSGKTMTLKTLIFNVASSGGTLPYKKPKYAKDKYYLSNTNKEQFCAEFEEQMKNPLALNSICDITAKFNYMGKVILITTVGDSEEYIRDKYEKNKPCDIFICAAHNEGKIVSYLESIGDVTYIPQADIQNIVDKNTFNETIIQRNSNVAKVIFEKLQQKCTLASK